jgi:hypothetical protein
LDTAEDHHQTFRWRPWPCERCGEGVTAIHFLIGRIRAGTAIQDGIPEEVAASQKAALLEWVAGCPHTREETVSLPKLDEGSEHIVYVDAPVGRVWKVTRPMTFGESYYLANGVVCQRNCSPLDYLLRLREWDLVFTSAPVPLGVMPTGQIVSVQDHITGEKPPQDAVDTFLEESGLHSVKRNCWLWKGVFDDSEIWVGDARDDNFVETQNGIVPIDVRVWSYPWPPPKT